MVLFGDIDMVIGGIVVFCIGIMVIVSIFDWVFSKWMFSAYDRETVFKIIRQRQRDRPLPKQKGEQKEVTEG
jgi:hypothetical protein